MGPDPIATFRQEANELLEQLEQGLLDLKADPSNRSEIDNCFRALHTIKGSGAMFGFNAVSEFVHEFETAFDRVRKGEAPASARLVAIALSAKDHIAALLESPDAEVEGGEPILATLREFVGGAGAPARTIAPGEDGARGPAAAGAGWRLFFRLAPDAMIYGANPQLLLDELRALGACEVTARIGEVPPLDQLDPEKCFLGWDVILSGDVTRAAIEDVFLFIRDGMELELEPLGADGAADEPAAPEPALAEARPSAKAAATPEPGDAPGPKSRASAAKSSSLRVAAERLDELMDRVGELVIAQARLNQLAGNSNDPVLKTVAEDLGRLSAGLRDTTMGIRMVPIGTLFGRFRRLVHDLAGELGKDIEFVTSGEDTELDKTMIEQLADPLVHMIRNAVDHGLEDATTRLALGKPARGTVRLEAVYAGAEVAISIGDDGAGLDPVRIRAKAEEAGLLAPDAKIDEATLLRMIMQPGFSTAKAVTALSGRGVGMDVVKQTIDALRGAIDIASVKGKGSTLTLRLPLTLAIVEGLLVRVGEERYSIPLAAIEECVELPRSAEAGSKGRSFLNIRGNLVPYLRLRDLFHCGGAPDEHPKVVIVASGDTRVGLVIDQILGTSQTVIKQLSKLHADVTTFSGATILGDGSVALILDVMNLVAFGQKTEAREQSRRAA